MNCRSSLHQPVLVVSLTILLIFVLAIACRADSQLAPIRITPERRQLIRLKLATVLRKDVSDRLETTGNIETDERLQGYVQTRFAGWIEQVFANSTYQYVRRGQQLFTIYSPDLVSTENEYLLAITARGLETAQLPTLPATRRRWSIPPRNVSSSGEYRRARSSD
jgi:hypothetical protein